MNRKYKREASIVKIQRGVKGKPAEFIIHAC